MPTRLQITLDVAGDRLVPALTLPPPAPLGAVLAGLAPEAAVTRLGRIFNLCRHAQEAAARLALDLPPAEGAPWQDEIRRDTVFALFIGLPQALGRAPIALPPGWQAAGAGLDLAAFGPGERLPESLPAFHRWLAAGEGLAPVLADLARRFAPGEAASRALPFRGSEGSAVENSPAMRHPDHPLLHAVAAEQGRGPLWRMLARLCDLQACLDGPLPAPRHCGPGAAEAPASRGLYRIAIRLGEGGFATVARRTPTDDICHPRGALLSALAALPAARRHLVPLVVACFDPCLPWVVREVAHA